MRCPVAVALAVLASAVLVLAVLGLGACAGPSPQARAVERIRDNTLAGWPYSDDQTVEQMEGVCRSLGSRSVADLLDSFAGQWSGEFPSADTQHDYGILIRYSIEGACPRYASLVRARDYRGHPGWEGVYYGDARR
jgi:hypothetical protein